MKQISLIDLYLNILNMGNKIDKNAYYAKLLERSHMRHKKVPKIGTLKVEKQVDWQKLQNHFKKLVNAK